MEASALLPLKTLTPTTPTMLKPEVVSLHPDLNPDPNLNLNLNLDKMRDMQKSYDQGRLFVGQRGDVPRSQPTFSNLNLSPSANTNNANVDVEVGDTNPHSPSSAHFNNATATTDFLQTPSQDVLSLTSGQCIQSGWLQKRSKRKIWKKRWLVLRNTQLVYYKDDREYKPSAIINSRHIIGVVLKQPGTGTGAEMGVTGAGAGAPPPPLSTTHGSVYYTIEVITQQKNYCLRTESLQDAEKWATNLRSVVCNSAPSVMTSVTVISDAADLNSHVGGGDEGRRPITKLFRKRHSATPQSTTTTSTTTSAGLVQYQPVVTPKTGYVQPKRHSIDVASVTAESRSRFGTTTSVGSGTPRVLNFMDNNDGGQRADTVDVDVAKSSNHHHHLLHRSIPFLNPFSKPLAKPEPTPLTPEALTKTGIIPETQTETETGTGTGASTYKSYSLYSADVLGNKVPVGLSSDVRTGGTKVSPRTTTLLSAAGMGPRLAQPLRQESELESELELESAESESELELELEELGSEAETLKKVGADRDAENYHKNCDIQGGPLGALGPEKTTVTNNRPKELKRLKVTKQTKALIPISTDQNPDPAQEQQVIVEAGPLLRFKKRYRHWQKQYVVLTNHELLFYKSAAIAGSAVASSSASATSAAANSAPAPTLTPTPAYASTSATSFPSSVNTPIPIKSIPLQQLVDVVEVEDGPKRRKHCLTLITTEKRILVCAQSEDNLVRWLAAINAVIDGSCISSSSIAQEQKTIQ